MSYLLLWVEVLAVAVLLVTLVTARMARRKRRGTQILWSVLPAAIILLIALAVTCGTYAVMAYFLVSGVWFGAALGWTVVYAIAAGIVIVRGLRPGDDGAARALGWSVGRIALADGAALVLCLITFWNIDLAAKTRLAAMRAEVGAIALAVAPARVPDRQNAAVVYQRAFDAMTRIESQPPEVQQRWNRWTSPTPEEPLDPNEADLRAFLKKNEPALVLLRRAAAMPDCYFEHNYGQPSFDELLPELGQLRQGANLLVLDAKCRTADGDARGALEDVRCLLGMAAHLRAEPIVIGVLSAAAIEGLGVQTLEETLASARPKAEDLALPATDESAPYQQSMGRAFRMEEAFVLGFFSALADTGDSGSLRLVNAPPVFITEPAASLWRVFVLPDDIASYRRVMHHYAAMTARPYHQAYADWRKWDEEFRTSKGVGLVTRTLVPCLSGAAKAAAQADARHQLVRAAVAVEAYRAKTGKPPTRLDDLVPDCLDAVPLDPFDGKPLRMMAAQGSIVLYSVGPDLYDNRGATTKPGDHTGDLTFRLPAR